MKTTITLVAAIICLIAVSFYFESKVASSKKEYSNYRDSICLVIKSYDSLSKVQDSTEKAYKDSIYIVNNQLDAEKQKYDNIKSKFDEIRNVINTYNYSQLDSFFKARYRQLYYKTSI